MSRLKHWALPWALLFFMAYPWAVQAGNSTGGIESIVVAVLDRLGITTGGSYTAPTDDQTLQEVTNAGAITDDAITVAGLTTNADLVIQGAAIRGVDEVVVEAGDDLEITLPGSGTISALFSGTTADVQFPRNVEIKGTATLAAVGTFAHGQIPVGMSSGKLVNLAPGTDGQVLSSDSTTSSGLAWADVAPGGFVVAFTAGEGVAPLSTTTAAPSNTTANSGVWSLLFDASTMEGTHFWFSMPPAYDSTATLNVELTWFGAGAGTNSVVWGVQFACFVEGTDDMDTTAYGTSLDTVTYATTAANATQGIMSTTTFSLTNAEIDEAVAGSDMLLEVERRAAQAYLDNFASDACLVGVRLWQ